MLRQQLLLGTGVILVSVVFHVLCLVYLASSLRWLDAALEGLGKFSRQILLLAFTVVVIIGIHTVEVWGWAAVYILLGEFADLSAALYFSAVTATTLGYGDVTLTEAWQILGTFESMGGLILFGASTAFLLELMRELIKD